MRIPSIVVAILIACSSGTGPGDGFQSIIGEFCAQETSTVTRQGNDATVVLLRNKSETREVTDSQGFRREQTVRSCQSLTCNFRGGAGLSDSELIRLCEERFLPMLRDST